MEGVTSTGILITSSTIMGILITRGTTIDILITVIIEIIVSMNIFITTTAIVIITTMDITMDILAIAIITITLISVIIIMGVVDGTYFEIRTKRSCRDAGLFALVEITKKRSPFAGLSPELQEATKLRLWIGGRE